MRALWAAALAAGLIGCTGDPGDSPISQGECLAVEPGQEVIGCEAGIPAERCGEGFEPDGEKGCVALLPQDVCPEGLFAVPGETACRSPASCEAGAWGGAPVGAATQYVDVDYGGGASDGTENAPWTSIGDAVANAAPNAVVAIAPGRSAVASPPSAISTATAPISPWTAA